MPSAIILLINTVSLRFPSLSGFRRSGDVVPGQQRVFGSCKSHFRFFLTRWQNLPFLDGICPSQPSGRVSPLKSSFSCVNGWKCVCGGFVREYSAWNILCERRRSPGALSQPFPTRNLAPSPGPALRTRDIPTPGPDVPGLHRRSKPH